MRICLTLRVCCAVRAGLGSHAAGRAERARDEVLRGLPYGRGYERRPIPPTL